LAIAFNDSGDRISGTLTHVILC